MGILINEKENAYVGGSNKIMAIIPKKAIRDVTKKSFFRCFLFMSLV